jgi:hypothetical protein
MRSYTLLLSVALLTGCQDESQSLYERAFETEVAEGLAAATPLYKEVTLRFPDSEEARLAAAKLEGSPSLPQEDDVAAEPVAVQEQSVTPTGDDEDRPTPANNEPAAPSVLLDLPEAKVGGLPLDASASILVEGAEALRTSTLGPVATRVEVEYPEGMPQRTLVVSFGDHDIVRDYYGFMINDPVFRSREGLGVGSKVADFERVYGRANYEVMGDHGYVFTMDAEGRSLMLSADYDCRGSACEVRSIHASTSIELGL